MTTTHTIPAAELCLGDTSSSGREFQGAVIFVELDEEQQRVQIFTDQRRKETDEGFAVSPHYGWWLKQDARIEISLGASEKAREIWARDDANMPAYGKQVSLEHRAAVAKNKITE